MTPAIFFILIVIWAVIDTVFDEMEKKEKREKDRKDAEAYLFLEQMAAVEYRKETLVKQKREEEFKWHYALAIYNQKIEHLKKLDLLHRKDIILSENELQSLKQKVMRELNYK